MKFKTYKELKMNSKIMRNMEGGGRDSRCGRFQHCHGHGRRSGLNESSNSVGLSLG